MQLQKTKEDLGPLTLKTIEDNSQHLVDTIDNKLSASELRKKYAGWDVITVTSSEEVREWKWE